MSRPTLRERFEAKYQRREDWECWPWTAGANEYGRGMFKVLPTKNGGTKPAPRVAYELHHGVEVPAHLVVMHVKCDNPNCVNPAHLSLGTQLENMRDMINKRRAGWMQRRPEGELSANT